MSFLAVKWALKSTEKDGSLSSLSSSEKSILIRLADYYNEKNEAYRAWPAISRLAIDTSLSEPTVKRVLRDLHARGVIFIEHWKLNSGTTSMSNRYLLLVYKPAAEPYPQPVLCDPMTSDDDGTDYLIPIPGMKNMGRYPEDELWRIAEDEDYDADDPPWGN